MRQMLFAILLATPLCAFAADPRSVVLDVRNMTCSLCPVTVRKALERVPGVTAATVDLGTRTATVGFDAERTSITMLVKATTHAGFPATARN